MSEPIVHAEIDEDIFAWGEHPKPKYDIDPPDYGDVMTVAEFLEDVENGNLIDYDGHGYPMRDGKIAHGRNTGFDYEFVVRPSKGKDGIPADATHIVWFNR